MDEFVNFYEKFGLDQTSTPSELKGRLEYLLKRERGAGNPDQEQVALIRKAMDQLGTPEAKSQYDKELAIASRTPIDDLTDSLQQADGWIKQANVEQAEFEMDNTVRDQINAIGWDNIPLKLMCDWAMISLELDRDEDATAAARRAMSREPSFSGSRYVLGCVAVYDEDPDEAIGHWQEALRLEEDAGTYDYGIRCIAKIVETRLEYERAEDSELKHVEGRAEYASFLNELSDLADQALAIDKTDEDAISTRQMVDAERQRVRHAAKKQADNSLQGCMSAYKRIQANKPSKFNLGVEDIAAKYLHDLKSVRIRAEEIKPLYDEAQLPATLIDQFVADVDKVINDTVGNLNILRDNDRVLEPGVSKMEELLKEGRIDEAEQVAAEQVNPLLDRATAFGMTDAMLKRVILCYVEFPNQKQEFLENAAQVFAQRPSSQGWEYFVQGCLSFAQGDNAQADSLLRKVISFVGTQNRTDRSAVVHAYITLSKIALGSSLDQQELRKDPTAYKSHQSRVSSAQAMLSSASQVATKDHQYKISQMQSQIDDESGKLRAIVEGVTKLSQDFLSLSKSGKQYEAKVFYQSRLAPIIDDTNLELVSLKAYQNTALACMAVGLDTQAGRYGSRAARKCHDGFDDYILGKVGLSHANSNEEILAAIRCISMPSDAAKGDWVEDAYKIIGVKTLEACPSSDEIARMNYGDASSLGAPLQKSRLALQKLVNRGTNSYYYNGQLQDCESRIQAIDKSHENYKQALALKEAEERDKQQSAEQMKKFLMIGAIVVVAIIFIVAVGPANAMGMVCNIACIGGVIAAVYFMFFKK